MMTGVEMTESSNKTNETSSRTVNGVAGLSIVADLSLSARLDRIHAIEAIVAKCKGAPVVQKKVREQANVH